MDRSRDRVQSIERGVAVLRAFDGGEALLTASDIAARTALPRPVVRRILLTFEHLGYARLHRGLWGLTPRIIELGSGYFAASSLPEIAYPVMADHLEATGETSSLGVLDELDVLQVARIDDHRRLPGSVRVGMRLPAYATAQGKVLLAALATPALDEYLARARMLPLTPRTLTDPRALTERLEVVRAQGYDVSVEELHPGMIAAAAPIVVDGTAVGALGMTSTTVRVNEQTLRDIVVPRLRSAAERIAVTYRTTNPQLFRTGP